MQLGVSCVVYHPSPQPPPFLLSLLTVKAPYCLFRSRLSISSIRSSKRHFPSGILAILSR